MANFAHIQNGVIVNIIVAEQDVIDTGLFGDPSEFKIYQDDVRVSIGGTYDATVNGFYPPKLYPSWVKDTVNHTWVAPVAKPNDGKVYTWDENTTTWVLVTT